VQASKEQAKRPIPSDPAVRTATYPEPPGGHLQAGRPGPRPGGARGGPGGARRPGGGRAGGGPPLLQRIDRYQSWDRRLLRAMLVSFGPEAAPLLQERLADGFSPANVRAVCADALGVLGHTGARDTAAATEPWSVSGGYVNYMQADEPIERVRASFGDEAFERLQALKKTYDPNNVLHRNQNIPPL
jgi:hypothetical protein